mmetsp:Transcript_138448/g.442501  ORF Transcript_138448/g.442501 Transcript_138448/m.442501 type:complete len:224 (+) Transcript_138448:442-1113(+)
MSGLPPALPRGHRAEGAEWAGRVWRLGHRAVCLEICSLLQGRALKTLAVVLVREQGAAAREDVQGVLGGADDGREPGELQHGVGDGAHAGLRRADLEPLRTTEFRLRVGGAAADEDPVDVLESYVALAIGVELAKAALQHQVVNLDVMFQQGSHEFLVAGAAACTPDDGDERFGLAVVERALHAARALAQLLGGQEAIAVEVQGLEGVADLPHLSLGAIPSQD